MQTVLKRYQNLDWYMIGSWNITANQTITVETVSSRDYTKAEILIFAPFASNRFQPSVFAPKYSVASYNQKIRMNWVNASGDYCYVDAEAVDATHFKLTSNGNIPGDTQILFFVLAYYGSY